VRQTSAGKPLSKGHLIVIFGLSIVVAAGGSVIVYSMSDWSAPAKARQMQNPVAATPQNIAAGMSIYEERCVNCHGENGDGKGPKAGELSLAPTNFTDAQKLGEATDGELFWKISEGHRPMPGFKKKLSDEQRWQAVDYVRTFAKPHAAARKP
jgi:mono/diheme cytochrome c family protein